MNVPSLQAHLTNTVHFGVEISLSSNDSAESGIRSMSTTAFKHSGSMAPRRSWSGWSSFRCQERKQAIATSQNDFAICSVAKTLSNDTLQIAQFRNRSNWWQNQWSKEANTSLFIPSISNSPLNITFTGFPAARNGDGNWNYTAYNPLSCGGCGWADDIYEAKVLETAFSAAPHDMSKIIELMGGDEKFVQRLDVSFLPELGTSVGANNDAGSALFNPGNEPSFLTPYLYNYVPTYHWKTANQTRATVDTFYSDKKNGYPGNIDGGALPSWLIFNLIGILCGTLPC